MLFSKSMVLAAAAALLAAPAAAFEAGQATASPRAAENELVELPFAPPLGRTLRYRLTRQRTGGPAAQQRADVNFDIAFRRSAEDYVMSVRLVLPPGVPPPDGASAMARILSLPTEFRMSATGEMIEVLDLERHWSAAEAALGEMWRREPMDARGREAVAAMIQRIRDMPPEAQMELFARHVAPIVAAAGGAFQVDESLSSEGPAQSLVGPLQQTSTVRVSGVDARFLRLSQRSSVESAELETQMRALIGNIAPRGRPVPSLRVISNDLVETFEVSRATGLTERYRSEKIVVVETDGERGRSGETVTLELVR